MKYNLLSSMADRIKFDEMQRQYAAAMLNALTTEEALAQHPDLYAEIGWESFLTEVEVCAVEVDDLAEAKARFLAAFAQATLDWQREKLEQVVGDELYQSATGHTSAITVIPGGQKDGLNFGPVVIEIVVLEADGDTIAYRYSDDSQDADWQIGGIEDAVDAALDVRLSMTEEEDNA